MSQLVELRSDYFMRYWDRWRVVFFGGSFRDPANFEESLALLRWLTAVDDTPFAAWVRVVADNLRLEEHIDPQSLANAAVAERTLIDAGWGRNRRVWAVAEFTHRELVRTLASEDLPTFFVAPGEDDAANPSFDVSANVSTLRQCGAQLKTLSDLLRALVDGARVPTEAEIQQMNLVLERQEAIVRSANVLSRIFLREVCEEPARAAIDYACAWSHERRGASTSQARQRCPQRDGYRWPR